MIRDSHFNNYEHGIIKHKLSCIVCLESSPQKRFYQLPCSLLSYEPQQKSLIISTFQKIDRLIMRIDVGFSKFSPFSSLSNYGSFLMTEKKKEPRFLVLVFLWLNSTAGCICTAFEKNWGSFVVLDLSSFGPSF